VDGVVGIVLKLINAAIEAMFGCLMELRWVKRYQTRWLTDIEQVTIAMTVDRGRSMT
jgi:hypothetical protein